VSIQERTPSSQDNYIMRIPYLGILLVLTMVLDFLQSRLLPLYLNIDWTLVFVFYIGWSSNPVKGSLAGTVFGIAQDFLLGVMLGLNGVFKTLIGYFSSYLGTILNPDLEGLLRFVLIAFISFVNNLTLYWFQHVLTNTRGAVPLWTVLSGAVLTGIAGDLLFRLLDRLQSRPKQFFS